MEASVFQLNPLNLILLITLTLFILGLATFIIGVILLALRTGSGELKNLAAQTAKLAQKGIAEDVSGLVGNASNLIEAMTQLIRTSAGIGVFITVIGVLIMAAASFLAFRLFFYQP
jgi:hypothetical protein